MVKRADSAQHLRARILDAMHEDLGVNESLARPFVESVMRCFAGEQPYFPANPRGYPVGAIRSALEQGDPPNVVAARFCMSRSNLYRLFPGGLPGKQLRKTVLRGTGGRQ